MRCPFCSGKLVEVESKSAFIDICSDCQGIWFDSGEFVDFIKSLTESEEISPQTPQLFIPAAVKTVFTVKEKDKICPRCNQPMQRFNYAYDSNVFLDKCLRCGGMWADRNEIKEVVKYIKRDGRIEKIMARFIEKDPALTALEDLAKLGNARRYSLLGIPIGDELVAKKFPKITLSIIGLCTLIYICEVIFISDPVSFVQKFGSIPAKILKGEAFYSLFTSIFLHGSILHLLGNMFFFWIFSDNVEDRFSSLGYMVFYLTCGLIANFAHIFFASGPVSSLPAIGASGAISGVMGAYFVFYPLARIRFFAITHSFHLPASLYLGIWFLYQLLYAAMDFSTASTNVAWFAHIGGFLFGVLVAYFRKKITH